MLDATAPAAGPVFDGPSYRRVGARLMRAAAERPQLGLKLGAQPAGADAPAYWFVGTIVATEPGASAGDVRFSSFTPRLRDLADKMEGEFDGWVLDVEAALAAGVLHRVTRAHGSGVAPAPGKVVLRPVRLDLAPAPEPQRAGPVCAAAEVGEVYYAEAGAGPVMRRRRQR